MYVIKDKLYQYHLKKNLQKLCTVDFLVQKVISGFGSGTFIPDLTWINSSCYPEPMSFFVIRIHLCDNRHEKAELAQFGEAKGKGEKKRIFFY
jgi:hypothetical protein